MRPPLASRAAAGTATTSSSSSAPPPKPPPAWAQARPGVRHRQIVSHSRRSATRAAPTAAAPLPTTCPSIARPPPPAPAFTGDALPAYDPSSGALDLVVAGGGPSGMSVAARVARAGFRVAIVDPAPLAAWPNNYGVWVDEFEAMGLEGYLDTVWPRAAVRLTDGEEGLRSLDRPYGRVDRAALKARLLSDCVTAGVTFVRGAAVGVEHDATGSTLAVGEAKRKAAAGGEGGGDEDASGGLPPPPPSLRSALVLDATGHARRLVSYDAPFDPGFQGAYGAVIETAAPHPFPVGEMLFMDWRAGHLEPYPDLAAANAATPTFLYAMPFSPTLVFVEETSLVARPAVPFPELKARLEARLAWLGVEVTAVHEEEFCLIPMGGVLPAVPQRTLGLGGTAGQVHPSTGYMVARMLGAAPVLADAVVDALAAGLAGRTAAGAAAAAAAAGLPAPPPPPGLDVDAASSRAWASLWPAERRRQRAFFCFGMDVLLRLDLAETRQFFTAFFALPAPLWTGFLSARLGFGQLIAFGLALFARSSNSARADLLVKGLPGLVRMLGELASGLAEGEPRREA